MTPAQCRAAQELLDWTQIKLAEASGIAVATVIRFERNGKPMVAEAAEQAIQHALEAAGVEFTNCDEPGEAQSEGQAEMTICAVRGRREK